MMYEALGKGADYPPRALTRRGLEKLLVIGEHEAYCQPCVSPVWDTSLTCHALLEAGGEALGPARQGLDWLKPKQVLDVKGDWAVKRPEGAPRRLGLPVQQRILSRPRRYRGRGDGDGPRPSAWTGATTTTRRSPAAASGSRACRVATAAGPPSTSTISNIT